MKENLKIILVASVTAVLVGLVCYLNVLAFNGPSQTPPSGSGAIGSGGGSVSIGTTTPASNTSLLIVGSTSDSSAYGLNVLNSAQTSLFSVRNDGTVSVGTSTISGGSFAGTVSAGNVSAGDFGSNTGGGTYSFPGSVGIGTSIPGFSLDVNGTIHLTGTNIIYFNTNGGVGYNSTLGTTNFIDGFSAGDGTLAGTVLYVGATNVGIGTTTPATALDVAGDITDENVTSSPCLATNSTGIIISTSCGGAGTVTTSTAVTTNDFPFWNTSSGLSGTSTLTISGTTVTQANNFLIGGTLNVTSTAVFRGNVTFDALLVATSTSADSANAATCGTAPTITGANGIGKVTTGSNASSTCTISFGTAFANTPTCVITEGTSVNATTTYYVTPSTSKLIIQSDVSSTAMKSNTFYYMCIGH